MSKTLFYKAIDMTTNGFLQMVENNSMKITTLQKIADVLRVPITVFFEEDNFLTDEEAGLLPSDIESPLQKEESIDRILKRYEGFTESETVRLMARHIEAIELKLDMASYLAKVRLEKIEKMRSGGGSA